MKTGIELIAQERQEQIEKHGYTEEYEKSHPEYYSNHEFMHVARGLLRTEQEVSAMDLVISMSVKNWNIDYLKYADSKPYKQRLIIAGALIAAELDRLNAEEKITTP